MAEYLNVYDEDYNWIGKEERSIVHTNGKWHYVFHCWVYDQKKHQIILQRRAESKVQFPKRYDASCTGHYSSDEKHDSTKELMEELGVEISYDQLIYLTDFQDVFRMSGRYDREIARVHLLITDTFKPAPSTPEEIDSIVACDYKAFKKLVDHEIEAVEIECLYGNYSGDKLTHIQLVPRLPLYYQKVFNLIHTYITKL